MKTSKMGFTLLEIMIVVGIIGLLAVIAVPSFMKARANSQRTACINNLRQIESAKEQWALENRKANGDLPVDAEVDAFMRTRPVCGAGGAYSYNRVGTDATCSITVPKAHAL